MKRNPSKIDVVGSKSYDCNLTYMMVPVVPESLKDEIITYFHSSPEFGHFGRRKTIDSIKRRFFWENMDKEISNFKSLNLAKRVGTTNLII